MTRKGIVLLLAGVLVGTLTTSVWAAVEGREIDYRLGETVFKGYLAWNSASKGRAPGVLVVHEWWGHNDYVRQRARQLAELGYVALAVDMYGNGEQADHPEQAGMFAAMVSKNREVTNARFNAALTLLREQPQTDPARLAAIGYCFGGGVVLNQARQGAELKGVASFHGPLASESPAAPGAIKARLLVATGAADVMVPPEQVAAFAGEMVRAGADLRLLVYPGARHSFSNPAADDYARRFKLPVAYQAAADRRSWDELTRFLAEIFAP